MLRPSLWDVWKCLGQSYHITRLSLYMTFFVKYILFQAVDQFLLMMLASMVACIVVETILILFLCTTVVDEKKFISYGSWFRYRFCNTDITPKLCWIECMDIVGM